MTHNTIDDVKMEILAKKVHEWLRSDGDSVFFDSLACANYVHHQLQKARQDWLREEIEKLKGMKRVFVSEDDFSGNPEDWDVAVIGHNKALQSIIDRYQAELDQGKKYTMGVDFAKRDHSELDQDKK